MQTEIEPAPIRLLSNELNGKKIAYSSETTFLVQVGRYSKGRYSTKYAIKGNLVQAVRYFEAIDIGNGYKKRLICFELNKPLLLRHTS